MRNYLPKKNDNLERMDKLLEKYNLPKLWELAGNADPQDLHFHKIPR